jgi:hypothetical protein
MVPTCTKLSECQAPRFEPAAVLLIATNHLALCTLCSATHRWLPTEQEAVTRTVYTKCPLSLLGIEPGFIGRPDLILASLATGMLHMHSTCNGGPAHACLDGHLLVIRKLVL